MNPLRTIWSKLRSLWQRREVKREIDEELRFHLEARTAENIANGMSPEEAAREARKRFGNLQNVREDCRARCGASLGEGVWRDVRFAIRQLLKSPSFTAVALLTLALGIGVCTAVFSMLNAVVLQPLPLREPERLVQILKSSTWHGPFPLIGRAELIAWQRDNPAVDQVAPYASGHAANWSRAGEAVRVRVLKASASLLPLLGVQPVRGRAFLPEEDQGGGPPVAVVTHAFWQRRLAGISEVVGTTITLDNQTLTVVGVLPVGFEFPGDYEVVLPLRMGTMSAREHYRLTSTVDQLRAVAKLRPGVTPEQAATVLDAIYQGVRDADDKGRISVADLRGQVIGVHGRNLQLLFWIAGFVLLIVCANLANLLLARATTRRKEMAIRAALGAGRKRIVRQLLTESIVLALAGGLLGLLAANWGLYLLTPLVDYMPKLRPVSLNAWAFGFALLLALVVGIIFGLAPALTVARDSLHPALSDTGRGPSQGASPRRLQDCFVVVQMAVALVVELGTGLFLLSRVRAVREDAGFDTDRLLSFKITLSAPRYDNEATQGAFFNRLLEAIRALPGVEEVGIGLGLPLDNASGGGSLTTTLTGQRDKPVQAGCSIVNTGYLNLTGLRLVRGRSFTPQDRLGRPEVALVNEAFVRAFLADQEPLGQTLAFGNGAPTIVGVVSDRAGGQGNNASARVLFPFPQHASASMAMLVRTRGNPLALAGIIRASVAQIDPTQPLYDIRTMEQRLADRVAFERIFLNFSGLLAAVAVALAGLGIYGVMAYTVTQRSREIGIRMALGATSRTVLGMITRQGLVLAACGTGVGLLGGLALTQVLIREMYGMPTRNPWMFAASATLMMLVALLACWLPARRAARVDPMVALRCE